MDNLLNNPSLSIEDLAMLREIIKLAATRGAFHAPYLTDVGEVYDKLDRFLNQVIQQAESENKGETKWLNT